MKDGLPFLLMIIGICVAFVAGSRLPLAGVAIASLLFFSLALFTIISLHLRRHVRQTTNDALYPVGLVMMGLMVWASQLLIPSS